MPQFITDLVYRKNHDETWTLVEPLAYESSEGAIVVRKGFNTDLASVPQLAQNLISKVGPWDRPAVIHDWLYTNQFQNYPKDVADKIFLEAMIVEGVSWFKRQLIYNAVRWFGFSAWNKHKADLAR